MRKVLISLTIITVLIFAASSVFAASRNASPHEVDNAISCTDCHSQFSIGSFFNGVCQSCHNNTTGGGFSKNSAPFAETHLDANDAVIVASCIDCHHRHEQDQLVNGSAAYLVTATLDSLTLNGDGTSTFFYSGLTVHDADWSDPATWSQKTGNVERGLILVDTTVPWPVAEVIAADAGSITVKGESFEVTPVAGNTIALMYGMFLKSAITTPGGPIKAGKLVDREDLAFNEAGGSQDPTPNGVCQICHTATKYWKADGTNASHNNGQVCTNCHLHPDGFKPNCGGCHGNPPTLDIPDGNDGLIVLDRTGAPGESGSVSAGAHSTHVNKGLSCEACHKSGMLAGTGDPGADDMINIDFFLNNTDIGGTYDGQPAVAGGPFPYVGGPSTTVSAAGTLECSNIYCHGSTLDPDGGTDITPVWNDPATGQCGTCHGATTANPPTRAPHEQHAGPSTGLGHDYQCSLCHTDPSIDASLHVNMKSEITFDVSDPKVQSATYDGTDAVLDAYGNCSTVYCHSNVQTSPPGGAITYQTVNWGDAAIEGCSDCHEGPVNHFSVPVTGNTTGSHLKHGNSGIVCSSCHANDPALDPTDPDQRCNICHTVDGPHVTHANYAVDVNFADIYGGNYSGTPAPGDAYGSCSTTYCHSTGQGATADDPNPTYSSPSWGNPASGACGTCHSNSNPGTGSHTIHIVNAGAICDNCHTGAGDGTSYVSANHVNNIIDVSNGYSLGGVPGDGYGTCSTASCHGGYTTPQWGTATAPGDRCTICHASPPVTGSHAKHVMTIPTAYGETTVNNLGGEQYDFGCGNCHPTDEATYHRNGTVDLSLNKLDGGPIKSMNNAADQTSGYTQIEGSNATCTAAYCHSNGYQDNLVYQPSPDWYGGSFAGDKCSNCHGNSPNSGGIAGSSSHYTTDAMGTGETGGHFVGIHYDNIFTGSTGLEAAGNTARGSHGNPTTSSTIGCQTCHSDTVAVSANDLNTICSGCHGTTAALQGNVSINASGVTHVNGHPDVVFNAAEVLSKAQLRDASIPAQWDRTVSGVGYKADDAYDQSLNQLITASQYDGGTKTCAVSCHNDNPVQWGDTGVDCNSCHTGL